MEGGNEVEEEKLREKWGKEIKWREKWKKEMKWRRKKGEKNGGRE